MPSEPTITVKIRRDLIDQLRPIAAEHNRSMHGELKTALERYIEQQHRAKERKKAH